MVLLVLPLQTGHKVMQVRNVGRAQQHAAECLTSTIAVV